MSDIIQVAMLANGAWILCERKDYAKVMEYMRDARVNGETAAAARRVLRSMDELREIL